MGINFLSLSSLSSSAHDDWNSSESSSSEEEDHAEGDDDEEEEDDGEDADDNSTPQTPSTKRKATRVHPLPARKRPCLTPKEAGAASSDGTGKSSKNTSPIDRFASLYKESSHEREERSERRMQALMAHERSMATRAEEHSAMLQKDLAASTAAIAQSMMAFQANLLKNLFSKDD